MLVALVLTLAQPKLTQPTRLDTKKELTVEYIMNIAASVGHAPRGLRWSADGKYVRFSWAKADGSQNPPYKNYTVQSDGTHLVEGIPESFSDAGPKIEFKPEPTPAQEVYIDGHDLMIRDTTTKATRKIASDHDASESPKLTDDGQYVIYTKAGNLYRVKVADGTTTQLTNLQPETYPAETKTSQQALAAEEAELFKDFPPEGNSPAPGANSSRRRGGFSGGNTTFTLSPGGSHASAQIYQAAPPSPVAQVPNYVTRSGYSEMILTYPKVGFPHTHSKLILVDIKTGTITEVKCPRPGTVEGPIWSPDHKRAIILADADDHKDSWTYSFDPATDKLTTIWNEHDDAWIGGPARGFLGWLPDSSKIYFESENSGYAHLMTATPDGTTTALTEGKFEVSEVHLDAAHHRFIFVSSEGSPFKRHIDSIDITGGPRQKLADYSADEDASFAISPDGSQIAVVRSSPNRPSELFVNNIQVTTTPTKEWLDGPWIVPTVVMVPAKDGTPVPARLYKPSRWRRGGPAVVFIHGAGYLQNVYEGWSHYFREYMFHHLLMQKGYAVLDIDYRGSAGYGKAWRTAIYRHMGGKDLDDAVDGAAYLTKELGVNPKRIGIYGGSYGGFLTLMAMFTSPDTFAAGAALRPVSDWANYNDGYTSDILNLPQNDPEAYRQSSPIYFAQGLKGALLICHGMVDTNVHFQDTVRLMERLIELGKKNWSVAPYPVEDHAFRRADSWTDEYSRIFDLFERTIGPGYRGR